MTGKDAGPVGPRKNWKTRISILIVAIALVVVCFAARRFWGPGPVKAQGRRTRSSSAANRSTAQTVAARQTAPASNTHAGDPQPSQRTAAAIVNGHRITRDDLARECLRRYGQDILESIINKHLIWQACQERGVAITEQDVENEIDRMASKFGLSKDRWLSLLQTERDISPDKYRREIIWPTLALRHLAASEIVVTQDELREAFESEYGAKVKVRMISVTSNQTAENVHKLAVENPEGFGDLAKEYSEDTNSASAGGLVPPIRKHMGHKDLEDAAFALQEGQISPIIHVANQYLILRCEKHLPKSYLSSQHLQPIQTQLHDQIRDRKLRDAAAELFQKLQSDSKIVNVYNDPQLRQQNPGAAAIVNGRSITMQELTDECFTRHGKEVIEGEINRLILQQELHKANKTVTEASIDEEIARAADAYGYLKPDGSPDVEAWLKAVTEEDDVTVDLYVRDAVWPSVALKLLVGDRIEVTKEDLKKGFDANYGERVEVLAIVSSNQRQANSVWAMARDNPTDQFFGELAHQYSIEPASRANFGKVPPIRRYSGQPMIEEEAFGLQPGELSGIVSVADKYIILRCLGRTEPVVRDSAAVEGELRKDIHEKKLRLAMAEEFDRLRDAAQIENLIAGHSQRGKNTATASIAGRAAPASHRGPARR
ncbi:MAG: peptidylprolyl isomerase [Pirellulaceae bacterium]